MKVRYLHIGVQEGETTKVDELLAIIGEEGEDISRFVKRKSTLLRKHQRSDVILNEPVTEPTKRRTS